jgi:hypothetical protein
MEEYMINWGRLGKLSNRQDVYGALRKIIIAANYGKDDGQWSITELINERSNAANAARRLIEGVDQNGRKDGAGHLRGENGQEFSVKLRVLTRQACMTDKDGNPIDYWDVTNENEEDGVICPKYTDAPKEGDYVWVKGDPMVNHPDTGKKLQKKDRMALHARRQSELGYDVKPDLALFYWTQYPVDADGCITVSYVHAVQLLTTKGKRIVLPEFTTGTKKKSAKDKSVKRFITNWLFEEAVLSPPKPKPEPEPEEKPKPKRKRRTKKEIEAKENPPSFSKDEAAGD